MESIKEFYPSFVARSGQVNTPPGSYVTIKDWIKNSFLDGNSNVLEIGCTTGFISTQINAYTKAKVIGVDLSLDSIKKARLSTQKNAKISFYVKNAKNLGFKNNSFSHVIIGGHLPWVPAKERELHIKEAIRVLKPNGFILTSLYYYKERDPQFVKQFNKEFNTQLMPEDDYSYWNSLFDWKELDLEYKAFFEVSLPSKERQEKYLSMFKEEDKIKWSKKIKFFIENGKKIGFFVAVFRKYSKGDATRQFPRGGIYTFKKVKEIWC